MEDFAKLLTSVAALVAAIAWPIAVFLIVYIFRTELRSALNKVPILLDRLKKASLPGLSLELDRVADAEAESGANKSGNRPYKERRFPFDPRNLHLPPAWQWLAGPLIVSRRFRDYPSNERYLNPKRVPYS